MKYIIAGTNRPNSRTMHVSKLVQRLYKDLANETGGEPAPEIIDLAHVGLEEISAAAEYGASVPAKMKAVIDKINASTGLIVVCPEYNGSMPGALKYFIDHWSFPDSYEFRPVCFVGLGGRFGALRPIEHLQGVFGFRNAYIYPERVFITDVFKMFDEQNELTDPRMIAQLRSQAKGFQAFSKALRDAGLDANAQILKRKT